MIILMAKPEDEKEDSIPGKRIKPAAPRRAAVTKKPGEKKPPKKITETYLHNSGLYYLQRYAASAVQFRVVMKRKIDKSCRHHADQDREMCLGLLDALVEKFTGSGLLNDAVYMRGSVASMRRRGLSQRMIVMKLQAKGLSEDQIKLAMEDFNEENRTTGQMLELEAAMKLARKKKYGPYAVGGFDHDKALAAFARAGFSFEVSQKIIKMNKDEFAEYSV